MINPEETKRNKARNLRFRKAICRDVNLDKIREDLYDISSECDNVKYLFDEETLINALDGDEDETYEFQMMFADLCAECERMQEDLDNEYIPEYFDDFFTAIGKGESLMGWDSFEGDYMGISGTYEEELAMNESRKRMSRMTKEQILDTAQSCFIIFRAYMGLRHRYDCLKSAMDILRDENTKYLEVVKRINEVYDKANEDGMDTWTKTWKEFDDLTNQMPAIAWIQ